MTTYINADAAAELGLQGQPQKVTVSVLNGQVETFETSPIECAKQSLDGKSSYHITAFTTKKVTGNMNIVDWNSCAKEWSHLKGLHFPKMGCRLIVDILIVQIYTILTEILEVSKDSQLPDLPHSDGHVLVLCTAHLSQDSQLILRGLSLLQI